MSGSIPGPIDKQGKLVTEQLPGGGSHTFGTYLQTPGSGSNTSGTFADRVRASWGPRLVRRSYASDVTVSGGDQQICTPTGAAFITPLARSRIDSSSSASSSSSSQSSSFSEKSGLSTTYSSSAPLTDTTTERVSKTWTQSSSSSGSSSASFLDLTSSSTSSLATSVSNMPEYLFSLDVMEYGTGTILPGKEPARIEYQGPGEIAFWYNGFLYELKPASLTSAYSIPFFGRYYAYKGSKDNQLKMVGSGDTILFIKPIQSSIS